MEEKAAAERAGKRAEEGVRSEPEPARAFLSRRIAEAEMEGEPLLLDGALGTELERRGVSCELPLWSAHALAETPEVLIRIHADYAAAGAEILTANTFRTQSRVLGRARESGIAIEGDARSLTRAALELARGAAVEADHRVLIAGSAPPLEDCYRPDLVPAPAELEREHREHAENLAEAGADLILIETMGSLREARAAGRAAARTGLPFCVSFISRGDAALLSGEPLAEAIEAVCEFGPHLVAVNCLPPTSVAGCLPTLRAASVPFGVYANLGAPMEGDGPEDRAEWRSPEDFASLVGGWVSDGASLVGGCCGTMPDHIRAISSDLRSRRA